MHKLHATLIASVASLGLVAVSACQGNDSPLQQGHEGVHQQTESTEPDEEREVGPGVMGGLVQEDEAEQPRDDR